MPIFDPTALAARARTLASNATLTGLEQVLVTLDDSTTPPQATLAVKFWNKNMVAQIAADPQKPSLTFPIFGGHRLRGGSATGQVQVTRIATTSAPDTLNLTVAPIGDYSTYTLALEYANVDPIFSSLSFKFRPGCFSIDCAPDWTPAPAPQPAPAIDLLARDYASFRHALIVAMQKRVPGWQPTSDADLSLTLVDLLSAAADELADYQDRVMNEAYLATARNRVSLARHARLVDYHIHQGNQASALLAVRVPADTAISTPPNPATTPPLIVSTGVPGAATGTTFISVERSAMKAALNDIDVYTWSNTKSALAKGDTSADLAFASAADAATAIAAWTAAIPQTVPPTSPPRLLIQEELDPLTGGIAGADPNKRQILNVTGATLVTDPLNPTQAIVRVTWADSDALAYDYCVVEPVADGQLVSNICRFHGNSILATSGAQQTARFVAPQVTTPAPGAIAAVDTGTWGIVCPLPHDEPLLYTNTPPDGITPPVSTLAVTVVPDAGDPTTSQTWVERIDLVHSQAGDPHFIVETDELLRSRIRFGNGTNGMALPQTAIVTATWRTGLGLDGNVGRDRLVTTADPRVASVWNPLDAADGRAPEPTAQIRRNAPQAYREYQLRAVTLADYVARAEEVPGVSRAAATYMWTGSWRTVRVTIDPRGTDVVSAQLAAAVEHHLQAVRLIGEDLEIRPPIYVPLRIVLTVCLRADVWPEDVRDVIEQELSDGYTPDGRLALFHPDNWTFGQALHESEISGRLLKIDGVEHIVTIDIQRWDAPTPGDGRSVAVGPSEIIQVHDDPDQMELGFVDLQLVGGRQ